MQNIRSHESVLLQLSDLITGAIAYNLNIEKKKVIAKIKLIERIQQHSDQDLLKSSFYDEKKMNLFFIDLK